MELFYLVIGGIISWIITHLYDRKSSKKTPEWAKPLIDMLPKSMPAGSELVKIVENYVQENPLNEKGLNANGEYLRYTNGMQVCRGKFSVNPDSQSINMSITFPAQFFGSPSVEISGEVSKIIFKNPTNSTLLITINPSLTDRLEFNYQATGRWIDPNEFG